jgi:L-alanine-DL-glutamate epimerase-like enolase superfamily enzyme
VPNQGGLNLGGVDIKVDLEVTRAVRQAAGDDMILLHDRVGAYTRDQALKMGLLLDELNYAGFEDPLPSVDLEGLVELKRFVHTPLHMGELVYSMYDFAELIRRGAVDVVRFIAGNIGGITGGMKLAKMAECFGLECAPHNYGDGFEHALHFHCELAMPNCVWFELMRPAEASDRPWIKEKFRIDKDGCIPALTKPGLGVELNRSVMDKLMVRIET